MAPVETFVHESSSKQLAVPSPPKPDTKGLLALRFLPNDHVIDRALESGTPEQISLGSKTVYGGAGNINHVLWAISDFCEGHKIYPPIRIPYSIDHTPWPLDDVSYALKCKACCIGNSPPIKITPKT